jgi:N utilization substance protein A
MNGEFIDALDQIEKEKGIEKDVLLEAIEAALISAYKRNFSTAQNVKVKVNRETGEVKVYATKVVSENPKDQCLEIDIDEAKSINRELVIGDVIDIEVTPKKFGRIAAQTAKQVVVQRIREAERGIIYKEFIEKENEIVTSMIQRVEKRTVFVDLGKVEGILTAAEQVPTEVYKVNDRLKVYILDVRKTTKGPQILVSRSHPGLVKRLFEMEVPEIQEGIVQIKGIAREAGSRTKIAVYSFEESVDPVGSCVGHKGTRVQKIVDELRGEKIDIIKWSLDPAQYIASALSPARGLKHRS